MAFKRFLKRFAVASSAVAGGAAVSIWFITKSPFSNKAVGQVKRRSARSEKINLNLFNDFLRTNSSWQHSSS